MTSVLGRLASQSERLPYSSEDMIQNIRPQACAYRDHVSDLYNAA